MFKSLEGAVADYTSGALDGYDKADVAGLLEDRLGKGREDLEDAREAVKALCEPVAMPRDSTAYFAWFCAAESGNGGQLKDNEPKRLKLYKLVATLLRAYGAIANELAQAGYTASQIEAIAREVDHYAKVRDEVKLASGDYIDLKAYEPATRHLIDTYLHADESEKISAFDDISLVQLLVDRGAAAVDPAYYEKMSKLLDALIEQRRKGALDYRQYLDQIAALAKAATQPGGAPDTYPTGVQTPAQRALYNNLGNNEALALRVDAAVHGNLQDGWRDHPLKTRRVRQGIRFVLAEVIAPDLGLAAQQPGAAPLVPKDLEAETDRILDVVRHQGGY